MSIRRDLLLRSALLRQPDMPPLPPLRAAVTAASPTPATRRKGAPRRRTKRGKDGGGAQH